MLLTLDLGNSNASRGIFDSRGLVRSRSVKFRSMAELEGALRYGARGIEGACVSSVVPSADA